LERRGDVNVGRRRAGLDLELLIAVESRSRHVFTEAICKKLARLVAERTGALKPVVYVYGDPHPGCLAKNSPATPNSWPAPQ
jgi:hypothetical protein